MLIMSKNQQRAFTPNLCLRALGLTGGALFANIALLSRGFTVAAFLFMSLVLPDTKGDS